VYVRLYVRDSGSAAASNLYFGLSPNDTDASLTLAPRPNHITNDDVLEAAGVVPCNADGDIYYQCVASGAGTMDVWIEIWGYEGSGAAINSTASSVFGSSPNYAMFGADGTLTLHGTATVFEDLNFDPSSSGGPAVTLPDYVTINHVIHREFTSANNQLCGDGEELPHHYKLGSTIYPHVHIFLKSGESAGTTGVTFTIDWELRQAAAVTSGTVTLSATSAQLTAEPEKLDVYDLTGFAGSAELGGQLTLRLSRTAGNAGDVVVITYGVHYEIDSLGSSLVASK
jgi:hypothetical protein